MPELGRVVAASVTLRASAPAAWNEFCAAMTEYAGQVTGQMVSCPPELLVRAQGMAIQIHEIAHTLNNAPSLAEKAQAARMAKR